MLDADNFGQHLFRRRAHHLFDLGGGRAGKRNEHVGEGDIDLWLFLARRNQHREYPEQQRDQNQQRGHLRLQKRLRQPSRRSERATHCASPC